MDAERVDQIARALASGTSRRNALRALLVSGAGGMLALRSLPGAAQHDSREYTSLPYIEKPVAFGNFYPIRWLPIETVVWHTAEGTLSNTLAWFNNPRAGVSSNYVMDKNGALYAMLKEYFVPYANGNWNSNQRSVTIEVIDDGNPYSIVRTDALYKAAGALTRDICQFYGIPIERAHVKGHSEVSSSHSLCPGNLDLDRIVREANGQIETNIDKVRSLL
jgi:hypothetical protein